MRIELPNWLWRPKPSEPEAPTLEEVVRGRLAECRGRLREGKGEWPKVGYVRDEVWSSWRREESALHECLLQAGLPDDAAD